MHIRKYILLSSKFWKFGNVEELLPPAVGGAGAFDFIKNFDPFLGEPVAESAI